MNNGQLQLLNRLQLDKIVAKILFSYLEIVFVLFFFFIEFNLILFDLTIQSLLNNLIFYYRSLILAYVKDEQI